MIDTPGLIFGGVVTVLWTIVCLVGYIKRPRIPGCRKCGTVCGHAPDCVVDSGEILCWDCADGQVFREVS